MAESKELDIMMQLAAGEVSTCVHPDGLEMDEWVFVNEKENLAPRQLFHMLYESVFKNKLGVMNALNTTDGKVYTLIVGVEQTKDGVVTWPLAKLLTEQEQDQYKAPTGDGNYL